MLAEPRKLMLETLDRLWALYPDLSLGQLIYFTAHPDSVFYISDELLQERIEELINKVEEGQNDKRKESNTRPVNRRA